MRLLVLLLLLGTIRLLDDKVEAIVKVGGTQMHIDCEWDKHLSFFLGPDGEIGSGPTCSQAFDNWNETETNISRWWI